MKIDKNRLVHNCSPLGTGKDWKADYTGLNESSPAKLSNSRQSKCIQEFKTKMKAAFNKPSFEQLPFISDFRQVLKGPVGKARIHYPRPKRSRDPKGRILSGLWQVKEEVDARFQRSRTKTVSPIRDKPQLFTIHIRRKL